ncbi:hypothetical protein RDI58_017850 [Solanum bulbocastanum]|uniref:Uncharacterized protein n=1 Tax=Solanum bulbocastanum TaxID=147425 RepID=A0AAN8TC12_SOLBU
MKSTMRYTFVAPGSLGRDEDEDEDLNPWVRKGICQLRIYFLNLIILLNITSKKLKQVRYIYFLS